jgi:hypothetical protein
MTVKLRVVIILIGLAFVVSLSRPVVIEILHVSPNVSFVIEIVLVLVVFIVNEIYFSASEDNFNKRNILLEEKLKSLKQSTTFVDSFNLYCKECKKAISESKDNAEILTIQTPLSVDARPDESYFEEYINETASQLLKKHSSTKGPKITTYKRLVVINNINNQFEIASEKQKLVSFVEAIYTLLNSWTDTWKPSLQNIHLGIVNASQIRNSPFSNLDILLIKNTHLVIAFPIENENEIDYAWGTSIHLNDSNKQFEKFNQEIPQFERIYNKVWGNTQTKKISFGDLHVSGNLKSSREDILEAIELTFQQIVNR